MVDYSSHTQSLYFHKNSISEPFSFKKRLKKDSEGTLKTNDSNNRTILAPSCQKKGFKLNHSIQKEFVISQWYALQKLNYFSVMMYLVSILVDSTVTLTKTHVIIIDLCKQTTAENGNDLRKLIDVLL